MGANGNFWKEVKFDWFVIFSWLLLPGIAMFVIAWLGPTDWPFALVGVLGALMVTLFEIHLTLLAIWHWKERYVGNHNKLWGAILILETTGWGKLIYLFRHILADRRNRGRYRQVATVQSTRPSLEASS